MKTLLYLLLGTSIIFGQPAISLGQGRTDTIVDSSTIGPNGGNFNALITQPIVTLNNNGDIVFRAGESGNASGLFFYDGASGAFTDIIRFGDDVNGNGTISTIDTARLNESGDVAFATTMSGTLGGSDDDSALWRWNQTNGISLAVREGQILDGAATAGHMATKDLQGLFHNGEIGFNTTLGNTDSLTNYGIYKSNGNGFDTIYRKGTGGVDGPRPKFNAFGNSLITAQQADASVHLNRSGTTLATASGIPGNGDFFLFNSHTIGDQNEVYFVAVPNDTSDVNLYSINHGLLAQQGTQAVGGTEDYGNFASTGIVTGGGKAAFSHTFENGTDGLFMINSGTLSRLVTEGDIAPDGNGTFGDFARLTETNSGPYSINRTGVVAFENFLDGTANGNSDNQGIFLTDGIDMVTAVREGGALAAGTVQTILWNGGRESNHQSTSAFNDYGQIVYRAQVDGQWMINQFTPDLHFRSSNNGSWDANSNWTLGLGPAHVHDVFIDPTQEIVVNGPAVGTTTIRSLQIGGNGFGELRLVSGTTIDAISGTSILADGVLSGDGTLLGMTNSAGTIAPGQSAGALVFDDLNLLSSSILEIELGGLADANFDRLLIQNDAFLNGNLMVRLLPGFELENGMTFDFIDVDGSYSGLFDGLEDGDLVGTFGGRELFVDYGHNGVTLFTANVPEPGHTMILSALGFCLSRRRRRS